MDLRELPTEPFKRHPWEIVRADFFARLLRDHVRGCALSVLDVGAGDGYLARRLLAGWPSVARLTCYDPGYDERWVAGQSGGRLAFTAVKPVGRFNLVLLLDVIEHAADDCAILAEATSLLEPGGALLLSVPAYQLLFSKHDKLLGHVRRYAPARLRGLVGELGLVLEAQGELFGSLVLPRALAKLGEVLRPEPPSTVAPRATVETALGTWQRGRLLTRAATSLLGLDAACCRLASRWHLPCAGLSTWVLALKR
jgi:hypothetical protein